MRLKKTSDNMIKVKKKSIWKDRNSWELLLLCMPAIIGYILFHYIPLATAIVLPFKDYKFAKGIFGSAWTGFSNFKWILNIPSIHRIVRNTMGYGAWFMVIGPVVYVIIALLLFEIRNRKALKVYQTVVTFPNFMSMVIVGYITFAILSPTNGLLNGIITLLGEERVDVYMDARYWPLILTLVNLWKNLGMSSMMYFASLMGIDTSLYEAAEIDGATRFQKMIHISIPHLVPLVCIFTIMGAGSLVGGNFDLFYLIPRDVKALYETTDILPTYTYRALQSGSYSMGATVSFVQSVVGMILVVVANMIVKKISPENSMF